MTTYRAFAYTQWWSYGPALLRRRVPGVCSEVLAVGVRPARSLGSVGRFDDDGLGVRGYCRRSRCGDRHRARTRCRCARLGGGRVLKRRRSGARSLEDSTSAPTMSNRFPGNDGPSGLAMGRYLVADFGEAATSPGTSRSCADATGAGGGHDIRASVMRRRDCPLLGAAAPGWRDGAGSPLRTEVFAPT